MLIDSSRTNEHDFQIKNVFKKNNILSVYFKYTSSIPKTWHTLPLKVKTGLNINTFNNKFNQKWNGLSCKCIIYIHQWLAFYCFNKNFNVNRKNLLTKELSLSVQVVTSDKLIRNTLINFIRPSECKIFNIHGQVGNKITIRLQPLTWTQI